MSDLFNPPLTQQFYAVRLNGDDLHGPFLRREAAEHAADLARNRYGYTTQVIVCHATDWEDAT